MALSERSHESLVDRPASLDFEMGFQAGASMNRKCFRQILNLWMNQSKEKIIDPL